MDLKQEIVDLLYKLKAADTYFNPHALASLRDAFDNTNPEERVFPEELDQYISDMWSW